MEDYNERVMAWREQREQRPASRSSRSARNPTLHERHTANALPPPAPLRDKEGKRERQRVTGLVGLGLGFRCRVEVSGRDEGEGVLVTCGV